MNRLDTKTRRRVAACLVEGCSLRATARMTGVSLNTVTALLVKLGEACDEYQDRALRNLRTGRVQADEIWSFCGAKDRNIPKEREGEHGLGSVWTWTAIDADSRLVLTWHIGSRDQDDACKFMLDVASRVAGPVQLTTDGHKPYRWATALAFDDGMVEYAQLIKKYQGIEDGHHSGKYSPPVCTGVDRVPRIGNPDPDHISTSYVERQNLTMRMSMRRFTRLTNGHSKKLDNHRHAVALHFMVYNFVKVHGTIKVTPAMAVGIASRAWTLDDVIGLIHEKPAGKFRRIEAA